VTYLPYTLTLRSSLVLTGEVGDPNSAATLHSIPGSTMRGVLAGRLLRSEFASRFEELILDGGIAFLHAYPSIGPQRATPVPISWRREKYGEGVHDLTVLSEAKDSPQLGGSPAEFVILGSSRPRIVPLRTSSRLHHQRDRARGHAWKRVVDDVEAGVGTMFFYESIDAGQTFAGVLKLRDEQTGTVVRELLPEGRTVHLGRSRRAGYGGEAVLAWGEPRDSEYPEPVRPQEKELSLRIVFTAPYIGRNAVTGQLDPTQACREVADALGPAEIDAIDPVWAFMTARGYNRKWRMRVPEALALRAGSVLSIRLKRPLGRDVLSRLEDEGVGERRMEGFGRVLVLGPSEATIAFSDTPSHRTDSSDVSVQTALLDQIEEHVVLSRLQRELDLEAASIVESARPSLPRPSLLARLLVPFRAGEENGVATLRTWLGVGSGEVMLRRPAREQLHRCKVRMGGKGMTLEDLLTTILGESFDSARLLAPVVRESHLRGEQSAMAMLDRRLDVVRARMIVGVLSIMAKKAVEEKEPKPKGVRRAANA
jgi:CRISPR-associated protein Csx10